MAAPGEARGGDASTRMLGDWPDYASERCVCCTCGAHLPCRIGLATVAGLCTVCGGAQVEPIDAHDDAA